jgi:hypothetical protein
MHLQPLFLCPPLVKLHVKKFNQLVLYNFLQYHVKLADNLVYTVMSSTFMTKPYDISKKCFVNQAIMKYLNVTFTIGWQFHQVCVTCSVILTWYISDTYTSDFTFSGYICPRHR